MLKLLLGLHLKYLFLAAHLVPRFTRTNFEVSDDDTTILCTKIVMNPKEKTKIKRPKKGKVISNQDFVTLQDEKEQKDLKCGDNQGTEDNHRLQDFDK